MKVQWKKSIPKSKFLIHILMTTLSLSACSMFGSSSGNTQSGSGRESSVAEEESDSIGTSIILTGPGSFDSADTAVLVSKNENDGTVTLLNLELGRKYTLSVEGTTTLYDKYGQAVSLEQIKEGDIVDVTFLKSKKRLTSMQLSSQAWNYESVSRYEIDMGRQDMIIGHDIYKIAKNTLFFSDGKRIELMDLNAADVLTMKGLGSSVLSVYVERGHGYLRLVNDENFIGGWIEIGQSSIQRITEDMLLTVPEGSYQIAISHKGGGGVKDVIVNRHEEISLDIGDLDVAKAQYGTVIFSLSPSAATLYVDGTKVDTSQPVVLEYGIHQLIAKADGYESVTSYLKVGQESAGIDITLDALSTTGDDKNDDSNNSDKDDDAITATSYYKVYIDAPEGAEVYLNGNYVGISPCNFKKTTGSHIITLRKSGYETRSYTVQIDQEEKDISYSFADLVKSETTSTESTE